jgi:hypothetical protein
VRYFLVVFFALYFSNQAQSQTTIFNAPFQSDGSGNSGYSGRMVIPNISVGGGQVRVSVDADISGTLSAGHVSVCVQESVQNCQSAPVEVTFGGASGFSQAANAGVLASDWIILATMAGQNLLVIFDITSAPTPKNGTGVSYWSSGASWNAGSPSGTWANSGIVYGVTKVEVQGGSPPPPPPSTSIVMTAPGLPGTGRLTLAHGVSRLYQDAAATFVDYAPDVGNTVPVIDSLGNVQQFKFTSSDTDSIGQTLTLDSSWTAGSLYDIYEAFGAGMCTGPAWSGTPLAPPTTDALYRGVKVNGAAIPSCRTTPTTSVACAINQCKFLGTIKISTVAGQVRCDFSVGFNRECGIWNSDNRIDGVLKVSDPTTTAYHFTTTGLPQFPAPLAGNPGFNGTVISGRPDARVHVDFALDHRGLRLNNEVNSAYTIGVGWNSTSVMCGDSVQANNFSRDSLGLNATMNQEYYAGFSGLQLVIAQTISAWCDPLPFQGIGTATALEMQFWYSGEEWIDSGDVMMGIKFRY